MKFRRERKPSPWLVQNIYLRDTWGQTYSLSRPRHSNLRRWFLAAMILFGLVDAALAFIFFGAMLFPTRPAASARSGAPTAAAQRTVIARRTSPTPLPTDKPAVTRPLPPTALPTARPTQVPPTTAPTVEPVVAIQNTSDIAPARTIGVSLPATLNLAALTVNVPPEPAECTPADQVPAVVSRSIKLCPGQTYRPFTLRGENLGLFGDKSAVIRVQGRAFGIVLEGARLFVQNVVVRAGTGPGDAATLLCLYPECKGNPGGVAYGGGILVRASETTIMDSDVAGGVAGIAAERVRGLKLINNRLDNSSGWGSYNFAVEASHFVGNSWSNNNRSCTTTDGGYFSTGCESAGWLCVACQQNVIARNTCTNSGDCFYMNGEGNLTSNYNRFHQNECRAAPHNCYEVTFSVGNEFVENIAREDPDTGAACKYPFWVGGSQVIFARNTWRCSISPETALQDATASTHVPTSIQDR